MLQFREDLVQERFLAQVEAELEEANILEIKGAPSFLINGKRLMGAQPIESFEEIIASVKSHE